MTYTADGVHGKLMELFGSLGYTYRFANHREAIFKKREKMKFSKHDTVIELRIFTIDGYAPYEKCDAEKRIGVDGELLKICPITQKEMLAIKECVDFLYEAFTNEPITSNEFTNRMKQIQENFGNDEEVAHEKADSLMCEVLKNLGYEEGIEIFKKMKTYYS